MGELVSLWPVLGTSLAVSLAATPAVRNIGVRARVVDLASDSRRVHGRPVPRIGGVAIVAGMYAGIAAGLLVPASRAVILRNGWTVLALVVCGVFIAVAGLYDDVLGASAQKKLAVHLVAAGLLYAAGFRIVTVESPFSAPVFLGAWSLPITLLWITGVTNAVNLVDGLDGLAGGLTVIATVAICVMGAQVGDGTNEAMALAIVGGVLGFLAYNVHPASIFMGDTGSLFLGAMLAALSIRTPLNHTHSVSVLAMIVVLGVPLTDMIVAIARRLARGAPIFSADREHLHHQLLDRGLSHRAAVLVLWSAAAVLAGAGMYVESQPDPRVRIVLTAGVVLIIALTLAMLGFLGSFDAASGARRRRNRERLRDVRTIAAGLRSATTVEDVYRELLRIATVCEARTVRLSIDRRVRRHVPTADGDRCHRKVFPLDPSDPRSRVLEMEWVADPHMDRDAEVVVEILCRSLSSTLDRIERRTPAPRPASVPHVSMRPRVRSLVVQHPWFGGPDSDAVFH